MGNFQHHIVCSTTTGVAVGAVAFHFGFDPSVCLVAAGLCSFAGMLPDIDSNSSKSFQECLYVAAGIGTILIISRLWYHDVDVDFAMFIGACAFLILRFGLGTLIKKYTVHRGMIHSIPVAILCGQLLFFVATGTVEERLVKAVALTIGFLSHLILDETFSIDSSNSSIRIKRSFGTALKWTNPKRKGMVTTLYAVVFCLGFAIYTNFEAAQGIESNVQIAVQDEQPVQHLQCEMHRTEIQRAAAAFLAQKGMPAEALPHSHTVVAPPVLPSALSPLIQIGTDWQQPRPNQPARIVLQ